MKHVVVLVTCKNTRQAKRIANALVAQHLVACVNIVPRIESVYWWQGKVERSSEVLLIMKTTRIRFPAVVKRVKELHSYTVVEVIAIPIVAGNLAYMRWIDASVRHAV